VNILKVLHIILFYFFLITPALCQVSPDAIINSQSDFDSAHSYLKRAFSEPTKTNDSFGKYAALNMQCYEWAKLHQFPNRSEALLSIGSLFGIHFHFRESIAVKEYCFNNSLVKTYKDKSINYYSLACECARIQYYDKALFYFDKYMQLDSVATNDTWRYYYARREIGSIHYALGNFREAYSYFSFYLDYARKQKYYVFEVSLLNDLGSCWREMQNKDSAIYHLSLARNKNIEYYQHKLIDEVNFHYLAAMIEGNFFSFTIESKDYLKALDIGKNEVVGGQAIKSDYSMVWRGYGNMATAYYYLKQYDSFEKYYRKFLDMQEYKDIKKENDLLRLKLKIDIQQNNSSEAQKDMLELERLMEQSETKQIERGREFGLKSKLQIKDEELRLANEAKKRQKERDKNKNILLIVILLSTIAAFFFIIKLRRKNVLIAAQSQQLKKDADHQKLLMKEMNHRVKNNLQLILSYIKLQSFKIQDKKVTAVLNESMSNIEAIALVHEHLYQNQEIEQVDLRNYITSLTNKIIGIALKNADIDLVLDIAAIKLDTDKSTFIGIITNELIINSSKHAFRSGNGTISIHVSIDQYGITIVYRDNGTGIDVGKLPEITNTGLKMIDLIITEDLGGSYVIVNDNGFCITMKLPG
jgi:two-component sensor histidine kinase/tetratricopeptide (TPR) repeat protein